MLLGMELQRSTTLKHKELSVPNRCHTLVTYGVCGGR